MAGEQRWNPWTALRARARTILEYQLLDGDAGYCEVGADGAEVVVLDPRLPRTERRAVLAHELVHLIRGLLPEGTPDLVVQREEHQVDGETARRLVPLDELAEFATADEFSSITVADIASEFDVPTVVAERALAEWLRWLVDLGGAA